MRYNSWTKGVANQGEEPDWFRVLEELDPFTDEEGQTVRAGLQSGLESQLLQVWLREERYCGAQGIGEESDVADCKNHIVLTDRRQRRW